MIISHYHKFIFFAVPKTATHSVRFALRPYLHDSDMEQVNLYVSRKLPFEELAAKQHGHITVDELKPYFSLDEWKSYFKFGFVRNPWDRFISLFFFTYRNHSFSEKEISAKLHELSENDEVFEQKVLFKNQSDFLCNNNETLEVDYIGKYENFKESVAEICSIIGIPPLDTKMINQSQHKNYREYYDDSLVIKVAKRFEKDIKKYNYSY